jgi:hypothetical protein
MTSEQKIQPHWLRKKKRRFSNPDAILNAVRDRLSHYKKELAGLKASLVSIKVSAASHPAVRQQEAAMRRRVGTIEDKIAEFTRQITFAENKASLRPRVPRRMPVLELPVPIEDRDPTREVPLPVCWTGLE